MKLMLGDVPTTEVVAFPEGTVPVEKPPERADDVPVTEPEVVPLDDVAGEVGRVVWIVMLIVLVRVWVNVMAELPAVSVQVVVQTDVELLVVMGEPGVLKLTDPVTSMC